MSRVMKWQSICGEPQVAWCFQKLNVKQREEDGTRKGGNDQAVEEIECHARHLANTRTIRLKEASKCVVKL